MFWFRESLRVYTFSNPAAAISTAVLTEGMLMPDEVHERSFFNISANPRLDYRSYTRGLLRFAPNLRTLDLTYIGRTI